MVSGNPREVKCTTLLSLSPPGCTASCPDHWAYTLLVLKTDENPIASVPVTGRSSILKQAHADVVPGGALPLRGVSGGAAGAGQSI